MATQAPATDVVLRPTRRGSAHGPAAEPQAAAAQRRTWAFDRATWLIVGGAMLLSLGVRLLLVRSIWVDEAIS
ncbi:MAG TPA: hypothetical protein VMU90_03305, partial [Solirubrobacteraceae bacterium]|nr:hypothetical protein [Solirubrobacteraceae bacterium]